MDIDEHYNLLLDRFNLKKLHVKYISASLVTTIVREGFYWSLLYFSSLVKNNQDLLKKCSIALLIIFGLNVPVERYFNSVKADIIKEIKIANSNYFNDRIVRLSKKDLITFDLVEYFNVLDHLNENLEQYINNIKNKYDIPIRIVTLVIIAISKNFIVLIGLFFVFYMIVKVLNERKLQEETELTVQYFNYEKLIRNYITNSKNFLINSEFNRDYFDNNLDMYERTNEKISELNHSLDMNVNIFIFAFIIIVIYLKIHELNPFDFFYYFLIIYDIEFVADKVNQYYKSKISYSKMQERLNYLNSFVPINNTIEPMQCINCVNIDKIVISEAYNDIPKLIIKEPLVIANNDHILITGKSGSGKTSLLYLLKGILNPERIKVIPDLKDIVPQTYLTLPNHKSLYSGKLYDIISNYSKEPNEELIKVSLELAKINNKLNKNTFVDIEQLSSGEKIRLLVARIIYTIKIKDYKILLFDEIDENLNDEVAVEIAKNLREVFSDKIILYITHNEKVKKVFNKKIEVKAGVINQ